MSDRSVSANSISESVVVTGDGNAVSLTFGAGGPVLPLDRKQIRVDARPGGAARELDVLNPNRGTLPLIGLAGSVQGKSKPARFGLLVHITAPTLHCGWEGHIQLEFYNVGAAPLLLRPGIRICQIILEQVTEPETYGGEFQAQRSDA